ncbi:MAG: hypothetical protein CM15mP127_13670 [Gammaproteobacteria bacterium]|nr:MAG: hypothetical protein CM15mP127_13670 [Gammaproteobacteria bacterium]
MEAEVLRLVLTQHRHQHRHQTAPTRTNTGTNTAPTPAPTPAPLSASLLSVTVDGNAYDVIQMSGVNASATPGGNAVADLRTVYAYAPDGVNDGLGTYQGSAWPYATTDRDISELIVSESNLTATFTKNSENQIYQIISPLINTQAIHLIQMQMEME